MRESAAGIRVSLEVSVRTRFLSVFCALATPAVLSACGGGSLSPATSTPQNTTQAAHSTHSTSLVASPRADVRFGLSPQAIAHGRATRGRGYWARPDKKTSTLFVSDLNGAQIRIYNAKTKNPAQSGAITNGIDLPINVAVDTNGTVYVANNGNSTVTEYPLGSTSPSVTLSGSGLEFPNGIAVDAQGTVYVTSGATVGTCYVLVYPKGASVPSAQIGSFGLPIGLAVDANDALYVADAVNDKVWEVPHGSTTPQDLGLTGLSDDTGVAVAATGDLLVSNYQGNSVLAFHPSTTTAFETIGEGMDNPYALGVSNKDELFVGQYTNGAVSAYKKLKTKEFESISGSVSPTGIAVYPGTGF